MKRFAITIPDVIARALSAWGRAADAPIETVIEHVLLDFVLDRMSAMYGECEPDAVGDWTFVAIPTERNCDWPGLALQANKSELEEVNDAAEAHRLFAKASGADAAIRARVLEDACKHIISGDWAKYSPLLGTVTVIPDADGIKVVSARPDDPDLVELTNEFVEELRTAVEAVE